MAGDSSSSPILTFLVFTSLAFFSTTSLHALDTNDGIKELSRRGLLSFRETPIGNNKTFDCSPSGPCVPCQYSEKSDDNYRCSETGYRIPLKCVEIKDGPEGPKGKLSRRLTFEIFPKFVKLHTVLHKLDGLATSLRHRRLLSDSTNQEAKEEAYVTYRSCIQTVSEEKLSVIGFEGIVFCALLASGLFVYNRKRQSASAPGFARIQPNSRF